jgi:peroxiredoxin
MGHDHLASIEAAGGQEVSSPVLGRCPPSCPAGWLNSNAELVDKMKPLSFEEEAKKLRERQAQTMPAERQAATAEMIARLEAEVVPNVIKVGELVPDFDLPEAGLETRVKLSEAVLGGPVVLSFYRGQWCPYCNLEAHALESIREPLRALGGEIYLVGPETAENALRLREKTGATIPLLTDTDMAVATAFGLTFELPEFFQAQYAAAGLDLPTQNPGAGWRLPIPATFVIGQDRRVVARHVDADFRRRMEPSAVLSAALAVAARRNASQ